MEVNDVVRVRHRRHTIGQVIRVLERGYVEVYIKPNINLTCRKDDLVVIGHESKWKRVKGFDGEDVHKFTMFALAGSKPFKQPKERPSQKGKPKVEHVTVDKDWLQTRVKKLHNRHINQSTIERTLEFNSSRLKKYYGVTNLTKSMYERIDKGLKKLEEEHGV